MSTYIFTYEKEKLELEFIEMIWFILDLSINERKHWVKKLDMVDNVMYYELARKADEITDEIVTFNDAIMHSKNTNPFVKYHCKKILSKNGSVWDWDKDK